MEKWKNVEEWMKRRNGWERSRGGMVGVEKCLNERTWKKVTRESGEREGQRGLNFNLYDDKFFE